MVYWVLLLITALFAYLFGSLDTMVLLFSGSTSKAVSVISSLSILLSTWE